MKGLEKHNVDSALRVGVEAAVEILLQTRLLPDYSDDDIACIAEEEIAFDERERYMGNLAREVSDAITQAATNYVLRGGLNGIMHSVSRVAHYAALCENADWDEEHKDIPVPEPITVQVRGFSPEVVAELGLAEPAAEVEFEWEHSPFGHDFFRDRDYIVRAFENGDWIIADSTGRHLITTVGGYNVAGADLASGRALAIAAYRRYLATIPADADLPDDAAGAEVVPVECTSHETPVEEAVC